ncbi:MULTISPECIES: hypothetical protein [unclassified Streptomyces]|uniref:hypothetical protein n=1 Tax=unclassified Streptomyces TaxID=2593676 RepID=UPI0034111249
MADSKNCPRTGPVVDRHHTGGGLDRRSVIAGAAAGAPAPPHEPGDPAQYRPCEVCHEPGADTVVRLFVADGTGGARSSYAHRGCAGASEAGVSAPC